MSKPEIHIRDKFPGIDWAINITSQVVAHEAKRKTLDVKDVLRKIRTAYKKVLLEQARMHTANANTLARLYLLDEAIRLMSKVGAQW